MAGGLHKNALEINNHIPVALGPYADTAALTAAAGAVVGDIGKLALQTDTGQLWRMTGFGPVTWEKVDTSAVHVDSDAEISGVADKAAPAGADYLLLEDSAASDAKKSASITNVVAAAPPQAHAPSHKDGGGDELDVEELATAGTLGQAALSDGAGGLAMGGAEDLATAGAAGQTIVSDGAGAMDLADIEDISTAGIIGTVPVSDGAAAVAMGDHGDLAGRGDDDHTIYSLATGTRDFSGKVNGVTPTADAHLATKGYTDDAIAAAVDGGVSKPNVDAATTGVLPNNTRTADVLQADANAEFPTIDGVAPVLNQTYLVKNEGGGASHINNGTYELTVLGDVGTDWELTRRSGLDSGDEASGAFLQVDAGTANGEKTFRCLNNRGSDVVNTDALEFVFWGKTVDHDNLINVTIDQHHARDHAGSHTAAAADPVSVENLATAAAVNLVPISDGAGVLNMGAPVPAGHKASHQNAGGDEIDVGGLSGVLADDQNPVNHASDHEDGGGDEMSVAGLAGLFVTQYMHKVTAPEVAAGFFTLPAIPIDADSVTIDKVTGLRQANKQVVGATGATPDFDVGQEGGDDDDISINNTGGGAGLSQTIIADDILIVCYTV